MTPDPSDLLTRWEARIEQLAVLRRDLAELEVGRTLGYRDAWLAALASPITERNKAADVDVAPMVAEAHRVRAEIAVLEDEVAYLKAAVHVAGRG